MRQLLSEGWMHNRVRMLAASFLVKDLHLPWQWGAKWFLHRLVDGDVANNNHGWQWTAGVGTDASPYYRVFNPTLQAERFDPEGIYIRRHVSELKDVEAPSVLLPGGGVSGSLLSGGYPVPMLDHGVEREEALRRLDLAR
jgi:deoxyribodipyrimidine photo-lyase